MLVTTSKITTVTIIIKNQLINKLCQVKVYLTYDIICPVENDSC